MYSQFCIYRLNSIHQLQVLPLPFQYLHMYRMYSDLLKVLFFLVWVSSTIFAVIGTQVSGKKNSMKKL